MDFTIVVQPRMRDEEDGRHPDASDSSPSLLAVNNPVEGCDGSRIVKDTHCDVERDTVLVQIAPRLLLTPLELHPRPLLCTLLYVQSQPSASN